LTRVGRRHSAALCVAIAAGALVLAQRAATGDDAAGSANKAAARLDAQVRHDDHVRVFVEYLEIAVPGSGPIPQNASAGIEVSRDGASLWSREFDSYLNILRMGPIIAPPGADLTILVWREAAGRRRPVAKIPFRVPDKPLSKTYSQGSLKKLTLTTTPVDVWVIPELPVIVEFALRDRAKKLLEAGLRDFHARLVDATDGQVRIEKFSVYEPPLPPGLNERTPGAIHVRVEPDGKLPRCSHSMGRPTKPGRITIELSRAGGGKASSLGKRLLHDFGHAYFGLEDEYLANGAVGCPDRGRDAADGEACFMNAPATAGREACRPGSHDENGDTAQTRESHADCWTTMTSILRADVGLTLLKGGPVAGPKPPDAAVVSFSSGSDVMDFTDSGKGLSDDAINEVVQRYGGEVGECLVRNGERTVVIEFTIRGVDGRVIRTEANGKTGGPLATCTRKVMQKMKFPTFSAANTMARVQISR